MDGDIVGLVLCSCDTQIGFGLQKRDKKVNNCGSETSQIYYMWLKLILLHQGIVRSLFLYVDLHVEMFLKEICMSKSKKELSFQMLTGVQKQQKCDI